MSAFWVVALYIPFMIFSINLYVHGFGSIVEKGMVRAKTDVAIVVVWSIYFIWITLLCIEVLK